MQQPGFWDDQQRAASVSAEHSRATRKLESFRALESEIERPRRARRAGRTRTSRCAPSWRSSSPTSSGAWTQLEEQRLFQGRYDAGDAVVTVHSGAGGTDSQDWAEMLLRMYLRWAQKRGFDVEMAEASAGRGGGHQVGDLPRARRERLRPVLGREGRPPAGAAVAVRRRPPPPHELRAGRGEPAGGGRRRRRDRRRATCGSRPTAPRAPAASTSTRPTRRCGSRTSRRRRSCSARTSARSRRTSRRR